MSPQLWTAISTLLAALGVTFEPTPALKAVIAAAGGLVIAVWQWQHHKTIRNQDTAAAAALIATKGVDQERIDESLTALHMKVNRITREVVPGEGEPFLIGTAAPPAAPPETPPTAAGGPVPAAQSLTPAAPSGYAADHD